MIQKNRTFKILHLLFKCAFYIALIQGIAMGIWVGLAITFYAAGIQSPIAQLAFEGKTFQLTSHLVDLHLKGITPFYLTILAIGGTFIGFLLLFKWLANLFKELSNGVVFRQPIAAFLYRLCYLMLAASCFGIVELIFNPSSVEHRIYLAFRIICIIVFYLMAKLIEQGISLQEERELTI